MAVPWFDDPNHFGAWCGAALGVLGGVIGTLSGVTGAMAARGIGRRVVLPIWWTSAALGVLLLAAGLVALVGGQPYAIWYPLMLGGSVIAVVEGALLPTIYRRYRDAEERQLAAAELRGGSASALLEARPAPGTQRQPVLLVGILLTVLPALMLVQHVGGTSDIWWTPLTMAPTIADARDRAEIYVGDRPLSEEVASGHLQRVTDSGTVAVRPADLRVRFNNWDRVRAARLPLIAFDAGLLGIGLALLGIAGLRAFRATRSENS
ncbi:hypothetical protein [Bradyrhizobium sp.]|jgi:hypothetical protein|uniref:hypothetical protein n=1 Tax=Bradyrhizobium sp. TaxID=376 RepID=UPI003C77AB1F